MTPPLLIPREKPSPRRWLAGTGRAGHWEAGGMLTSLLNRPEYYDFFLLFIWTKTMKQKQKYMEIGRKDSIFSLLIKPKRWNTIQKIHEYWNEEGISENVKVEEKKKTHEMEYLNQHGYWNGKKWDNKQSKKQQQKRLNKHTETSLP